MIQRTSSRAGRLCRETGSSPYAIGGWAKLLPDLPDRVSVYEVGPRDGLQNEPAAVGTVLKLRLIEALIAAGLKRIEITSFVSPRWIPQLADADELGGRARSECRA